MATRSTTTKTRKTARVSNSRLTEEIALGIRAACVRAHHSQQRRAI